MIPAIDITPSRTAILHRHQGSGLVFNLIAASLMAYVLSLHEPKEAVLLWLCLLVATIMLRALWLLRYKSHAGNAALSRRWENVYAAGCFASGCAWGAMFWLFSPRDTFVILFMNLIAAAFAFTTVATLSASLRSYFALILPIVLAQLVWIHTYYQGEAFGSAPLSGVYLAIIAIGLTVYRRALLGAMHDQDVSRELLAEQEALFNNSLVGLVMTRERRFVRVNDAFARIYGFTKTELEGQSTQMIYPDRDSWLKWVEFAEAALLSGPVVYEREYQHPDGQPRWLLAQGNLVNHTEPKAGAFWVIADITPRKLTELKLNASESAYRNLAESYRTLIETTPAMIWTTDAKGRYTFASERGTRALFGAAAIDLTGKTYSDFVMPDHLPQELAVFKRVLAGETLLDYTSNGTRHDGRRIAVSVSAAPLRAAGGNIIGASGTNLDITERQQRMADLDNARALLMSAVDSMSDGFALFDPDDRIVLCNQRYALMIDPKASAQSMTGIHVADLIRDQIARGQPVPPEYAGRVEEWIAARIVQHHRADGQPYVQRTAGGRWSQSIRQRTPDGGMVVLRSDITAHKEREQAAQLLAQHDALTGLPNRRLLHDRLAQALTRSRRAGDMVAVLLIDLDSFKPVNDSFGHQAGDEVLRVVAGRITECVRAADTVARFGGDEFVVVLDGLAQSTGASSVAEKIIESVQRPIPLVWASTRRVPHCQVGCSIGASLFPGDADDPETLIRLADGAMYQAKEAGRGRFVYHAEVGVAHQSPRAVPGTNG